MTNRRDFLKLLGVGGVGLTRKAGSLQPLSTKPISAYLLYLPSWETHRETHLLDIRDCPGELWTARQLYSATCEWLDDLDHMSWPWILYFHSDDKMENVIYSVTKYWEITDKLKNHILDAWRIGND